MRRKFLNALLIEDETLKSKELKAIEEIKVFLSGIGQEG